VASYIINIDLPWNPAVLEQRIARIYRIGQKRNIQVINLVAANTFEEQMLGKLRFKTSMFEGVLDGGEDTVFASQGKFNQIMEELHHTMQAEETRNHDDDEQPIDINDGAPKADEHHTKHAPQRMMKKRPRCKPRRRQSHPTPTTTARRHPRLRSQPRQQRVMPQRPMAARRAYSIRDSWWNKA
jgi:hypothetical protein